ncbi:plexin domain-containing protein 2-like isoform X2 [Anneissia japonica]|uniref:plexin domain-containing protein 2-like isoform X2 n=1 Tax=Anneissia japonica TaxID=1529436 RepID=UPI0014256DCC|nr:plexin domain-containing protein 2-like isoform X2 [Anneissia japonica]
MAFLPVCLCLSLLYILNGCSALNSKDIYNFESLTNEQLQIQNVVSETRSQRSAEQAVITTNETIVDDHNYYTSRYITQSEEAMSYWVDFDLLNQPITPQQLATNHRQAVPAQLTFNFPFYGHHVKNVLITTGGFVYMGDYYHKYLAATQYIAPLMANFDPSIHENSTIRYGDNGTRFTVEWNQVHLKERPTVGNFTFQVSLLSDGRIIFVYRKLAVSGSEIPSKSHPVRIGITDAYYNDTTINSFLKKRTIYEYHRVDLNLQQLQEGTAFHLTPKITCNMFTTCEECTQSYINFTCTWCEVVGRCSNGFDRYRQEWYDNGCSKNSNFINLLHQCPSSRVMSTPKFIKPTLKTILSCNNNLCAANAKCRQLANDIKCICPTGYAGKYCKKFTGSGNEGDTPQSKKQGTRNQENHRTVGIWALVFIAFTVIFAFSVWIVYAYRHPTSKSGIMLIEIRHLKCKKREPSIGVKYHHPDEEIGEI